MSYYQQYPSHGHGGNFAHGHNYGTNFPSNDPAAHVGGAFHGPGQQYGGQFHGAGSQWQQSGHSDSYVNFAHKGMNQQAELWTWFQAVDQDNSGQISASELQQALLNGNWSPFNSETCRMMIRMFDHDHSGSINVQEFSALWKYIIDWKACFDNFDQDRSGTISCNELQTAFQNFGYNLSFQFTQLCIRKLGGQKKESINFDSFIQCCVMLHTLTEEFKKRDIQRVGVVQLKYEEFLELVFENVFAHCR